MRIGALLIAVTTLGTAAAADLNGSVISAQWRFPSFDDVIFGQTIIVGQNVEVVRPLGSVFNINLEGEFVQFDFVDSGTEFSGGAFNGWLFQDTSDNLVTIEGYEIDSASFGVTGLEQVQLGFDEDAVWANFDGVIVPASGDFIRMKVLFAIFEDGFE